MTQTITASKSSSSSLGTYSGSSTYIQDCASPEFIFNYWSINYNNGSFSFNTQIGIPYDSFVDDKGILNYQFALAGYKKENCTVQANDERIDINIQESKSEYTAKVAIHQGLKKSSLGFSIYAPDIYDTAKTTCSFKDGILALCIPPKKEKIVHKIAIAD